MGSVINTNTLSLLTQNNLTKSQASMNTAIQRLSSGMRINRAKDDAAGQAIANRFSANIKGLTQAQRNANDGISLAQTTEGALNEINTNLQRVRELTVQSANGSNSNDDKASIQAEITQRLAEIDRTSTQTDFNGVKVLSSAASKLNVQVGANDGETIAIDLTEISSKTLGLKGFNVGGGGTANKAATKDSVILAGGAYISTDTVGTQRYTATANNTYATSDQVFAKVTNNSTVTATTQASGLLATAASTVYTFKAASNSYTFSVNDVVPANAAAYLTPTGGSAPNAAKVTIGGQTQDIKIDSNGDITAADDNAKLYLDATGNLSKTRAGGTDPQATAITLASKLAGVASDKIVMGGTTMTSDGTALDVTGASISAAALKTTVEATGVTYAVAVNTNATPLTATSLAAAVNLTNSTATGSNGYIDATGAIGATSTTATDYYVHTNGTVTDGSGANQIYSDSSATNKLTTSATSGATATATPLDVLDKALSMVDKLRGSLGAVQNRFDSVISNLGSTITNLSSSRSRIEDADYATEVSNMTRAQILQQAGTSVLAKANQSTQGVMSLLQ